MDKALEKIDKLKKDLEFLYIEKDNTEDKKDFKIDELREFYSGKEKLSQKKENLELDKVDLKYKLLNIKKWKRKTILKTILIAIFFVAWITLIDLKIYFSPLLTLIMGAVAIPISIFMGESGNYYWNREYLKTHKLEDLEKEIEENQEKYSSIIDKINILEFELATINEELNEVLHKIDLAEEEIKKLNNLRTSVINTYLTNNQEVDNLINKEYESQNQKKLNMKG